MSNRCTSGEIPCAVCKVAIKPRNAEEQRIADFYREGKQTDGQWLLRLYRLNEANILKKLEVNKPIGDISIDCLPRLDGDFADTRISLRDLRPGEM